MLRVKLFIVLILLFSALICLDARATNVKITWLDVNGCIIDTDNIEWDRVIQRPYLYVPEFYYYCGTCSSLPLSIGSFMFIRVPGKPPGLREILLNFEPNDNMEIAAYYECEAPPYEPQPGECPFGVYALDLTNGKRIELNNQSILSSTYPPDLLNQCTTTPCSFNLCSDNLYYQGLPSITAKSKITVLSALDTRRFVGWLYNRKLSSPDNTTLEINSDECSHAIALYDELRENCYYSWLCDGIPEKIKGIKINKCDLFPYLSGCEFITKFGKQPRFDPKQIIEKIDDFEILAGVLPRIVPDITTTLEKFPGYDPRKERAIRFMFKNAELHEILLINLSTFEVLAVSKLRKDGIKELVIEPSLVKSIGPGKIGFLVLPRGGAFSEGPKRIGIKGEIK